MVYGSYTNKKIQEDHPPKPIGFYGLTKFEAEKLILKEVEIGNLNCTIFRPRLIIGPRRLGILKNLFDLIRLNLPVPLIGNGKNIFQ